MSRELIEFSKQIDEQFEIVITGKKGLWDYFIALFFWSLPDRYLDLMHSANMRFAFLVYKNFTKLSSNNMCIIWNNQ